jgi:V/A-type H+-transporting ATPase subunit F
MKMYLISDNTDTLNGMGLAGVAGVVAHQKDEVYKALNDVIDNDEIGIVLIAEKLAAEFPEIISDVRLNRELPLIVEITDRHGSGKPADYITRYVREAIGIKLQA